MWQNRLGYFLNIFGLAVGIASFVFIFYYVNHELSYDQFHEDKDRIYRVALSQYENGELIAHSAENYPGAGPALHRSLPEIETYTRLYNLGSKNNVVFSREEEVSQQGYKARGFLYADSSFFSIFSFPLLEGDPQSCLSGAKKAVITESFAQRLFKGQNPMGQLIRMSDDDFTEETCRVTGVLKDLPENSHLKFDVLLSYGNLLARGEGSRERYDMSWRRKDMYTYVKLREGTSTEAVASKFPGIIDRNNPDLVMLNREDNFELQPVTGIHLDSQLADEVKRNGRRQDVYALILAGILVLIIAMINFLNYSVSRSMTRAKGFGIRKVFGAIKKDMYFQFIFEASFLTLLAVVLAVMLVVAGFPYFQSLTQMEHASLGSFFGNPSFLYALGIGLLAGIIFVGVLPSFILNRFDLKAVVKGQLLGFGKGLVLRRTLITFQIAASIALTIICLVVLNQINYLVSFDLGIDITNTFVVDRPGVGSKDPKAQRDNFLLFKNKLLTESSVQSVTGSSLIPGKRIRWRTSIHKYGEDSKNTHQADLAAVDENFVNTLGLDLVAGRGFSRDRQMDADTNVVITVKAAKILGYNNPEDVINKTITLENWDWSPIVIGVVDDYHQVSLRENTNPTVFMYTLNLAEYYLIKINPGQSQRALAHIERTWQSTFPGNPFDFYYLEDYVKEQYTSEQIFSRYMLIFAIISILIASIGLFNISLFTMVQRTKEIGVRKTLGASAAQIGWLLVKDNLKLIGIGSVLAFPIAYYFGKEWLANYVYAIPLSAIYFIIALGIVFIISILTVSFYTIKATRIDPVIAIKTVN